MSDFFMRLISLSAMSGVILAGILLIRAALGKRVNAAARSCIWAVLILRLLLPIDIPSGTSIYNAAPASFRESVYAQYASEAAAGR